jgi:tetratricopeptide (TPR) repeat protein
VDNLVIKPKNLEAEEQVSKGYSYYENQNYETAINGDSVEFLGFASIADEYFYTEVGNLASAYAGLSYFKLADYDKAIFYLDRFVLKDSYLYFTVQNTLGDCYAMKGETDKAISYFEDAKDSGNLLVDVATLMKLARAYESKGDYASALEQYKQIKSTYEGLMTGIIDLEEVDKYIENATLKNGK